MIQHCTDVNEQACQSLRGRLLDGRLHMTIAFLKCLDGLLEGCGAWTSVLAQANI